MIPRGKYETRSERAIQSALQKLSQNISPISATGGWFSTQIIAQHAGIEATTARQRLVEMAGRGEVRQRQVSTGLIWRLAQ